MDQICVLYGKYIWEFSLFMKNEKFWRYDIFFCKFECISILNSKVFMKINICYISYLKTWLKMFDPCVKIKIIFLHISKYNKKKKIIFFYKILH